MKLSVFVAILLPSVYAFVVPSLPPSNGRLLQQRVGTGASVGHLRDSPSSAESAWTVTSFFKDILGAQPKVKKMTDPEPVNVQEEMRKRVRMTQERKCMEGQLCSLLRIGGDNMSPKVEGHVRRLTHELEDMQANGHFGMKAASLAGRWKLLYSSAGSSKCPDVQGTVENISYVSECYRISHADSGVLRVYKRSFAPPTARFEDDTAHAGHLVRHGASRGSKTASAAATRRVAGKAKQPLHKRLFFAWRN